MPSNRPRLLHSALLAVPIMVVTACSARYAQVPPRLDLAPHGRIALVTFTADAGADTLAAALATTRFAEALLAAQRIELLELGRADSAWRDQAGSAGAPAVFVGHLTLTPERTSGSVSLAGVDVRSTVTAELTVRLVATGSGGTLWRASSRRRGTVGRVAVRGAGWPSMSVRDREEAYGALVRDLVVDVTADVRETWVKQ